MRLKPSEGRYRLERALGHGGMATVHLAHDETLGREVAIKRLSEALSGDEVFRERFMREARTAAGLSHPNIVAVFDVGEEDGPSVHRDGVRRGTDARRAACGERPARSGPGRWI